MAGSMARKRIGELLLGRGAITPAQLEAALAAQRERRQRLGAVLIAQGAITERTLAQVLSEALGLPAVQLDRVQPEWSAIHMLRARFCEQHELFPYALESQRGRRHLLVAMSDPLDVAAVEEIAFTTGLEVGAHVAPASEVRAAILRYYHKVSPADAGGAPEQGPRVGAGGTPLQLEAVEQELPTLEMDEADAVVEGVPDTVIVGEALQADLAYLLGGPRPPREASDVEELERKFWALMRIMARKGLLTREEFVRELDDAEEPPQPASSRVR